MAPLPDELTGESTVTESMRSLPTPFLTKTYQLVEDPAENDLVSWNEDGSTFIVWRPAEFARDLLPKYFKHNNFSSFVRQLNTYGFRKVVPDRWEFVHEFFKRDAKGLLRDIQRRKMSSPSATIAPSAAIAAVTVAVAPAVALPITPTNSGDEQMLSSNSSPSDSAPTALPSDVREENERLRKENSQLSQELCHMRGLCNSIYALMSNFGSAQRNSGDVPEARPLDLMPARNPEVGGGGCSNGSGSRSGCYGGEMVDGEDGTCPRLFGVSIGVKRMRRRDEEETKKSKQDQTYDIKQEPLDRNRDHQGRL